MSTDATFDDWKSWEETAEQALPLIGRLYRDHGVVTMVNGKSLVHRSPTDIVIAHRRGHTLNGHDLSLHDSYVALQALCELNLAPVELNLGTLLVAHREIAADVALADFIKTRCAGLVAEADAPARASRVSCCTDPAGSVASWPG